MNWKSLPSPLAPPVNQRRLMRDLNAIGRIGIGDHGAVTRLVFSIKELRSRQLMIHLMRQAGLSIRIDAIGNIFGRCEGSDRRAPACATSGEVSRCRASLTGSCRGATSLTGSR